MDGIICLACCYTSNLNDSLNFTRMERGLPSVDVEVIPLIILHTLVVIAK